MKHIEELILNTLIVCPETWATFGLQLTGEDFTGERRDVFTAIRKRAYEGMPVDYTLLLADLEEVPGGADAVDSIGTSGTAAHTLEGYCNELKESSRRRKAEQIGDDLARTGDISAARKAMSELHSPSQGYAGAHDASVALMAELERRSSGEATGLKTGLSQVDRMLTLEPGDLCVIAARPSMGKTAMMLNIARRAGVPVGIFSLEMPTAQLMARMVAMSGVDYGNLRHPKRLSDKDWPLITKATGEINKQGFWINDTGGLSIDSLESDAVRMVREHGVKLLCVDYLQLVTCKAENRFNEVSEVSRRLKAIAKNLALPMIVLSQLSRKLEERGGEPIPRLSDLRESGQIEQDADQVLFIYRPSVYKEKVRPGEADIHICKSRNDITGKATVAWQGHYQRFVNMAPDNYPRAVA